MKLKMRRSFYPIGHGAFAEESFILEDEMLNVANIVFDCGSLNEDELCIQINKRNNELIYNKYERSNQIDILFISHFHKDHINGIEQLCEKNKVDLIVAPFLNSYEKYLLLVEYSLLNEYKVPDFIKNLLNGKVVSKDNHETKVMFLKNDNEENEVEIDNIEDFDIDDIYIYIGDNIRVVYINKKLKSIEIFPKSRNMDYAWEYIPYQKQNSLQSKNIINKLKNKYKKLFSDGDINNKVLIDNIDDISKIINEEIKKYQIHVNNVVVYSSPIDQANARITSLNYINSRHPIRDRKRTSALYMGDFPAKTDKHYNKFREFYDNISVEIFKSLHLIQSPHHGSFYNHNKDFLKYAKVVAIQSSLMGKYNKKENSLPHKRVLDDLSEAKIPFMYVYEYEESFYYEYILLEE